VSVSDRDNGFASTLKALLSTPPKLETGVFGAAAEMPHGRSTVGEVCGWMEHGTPTVPERPFLSGWWDRNQADAFAKLSYLVRNGIKEGDMSWDEVFSIWGADCVKGIREEMTETPPPLAESTVKRKGHDLTLFDSGLLYDSISFRIVRS
jgi:hypothetical protein